MSTSLLISGISSSIERLLLKICPDKAPQNLSCACREHYKMLSRPRMVLLANLQASLDQQKSIMQALTPLQIFNLLMLKQGSCNGLVCWFEVWSPVMHSLTWLSYRLSYESEAMQINVFSNWIYLTQGPGHFRLLLCFHSWQWQWLESWWCKSAHGWN